MSKENDFSITGKPVDYFFLPGEPRVVSHGEFRLDNRSERPMTCSLDSCDFIEMDQEAALDTFYVYAGDDALDRTLTIPRASGLEIRVTFPFQEVRVGIRERYAVRLNVTCAGESYSAVSELNITQELPG